MTGVMFSISSQFVLPYFFSEAFLYALEVVIGIPIVAQWKQIQLGTMR